MKFKKFAAIILSLAVIFAMSIPVFAADSNAVEVNAEDIMDVINGATEDISVKLTEDIISNPEEEINYVFSIADGVTVTINTNDFKLGYCAFKGDGKLVINGDVISVLIYDVSTVINGNITAFSGNKDECDMTNPEAYSDGYHALYVSNSTGNAYSTESSAQDNFTVVVNGNITGGKSYGTFGYGGCGMYVEGNADITVNGDITGGYVEADPTLAPIEENEAYAGDGIELYAINATVTVNGNVTGGDTNAKNGFGGTAIHFGYESIYSKVYVNGTVASGSGTNETDSAPITYGFELPYAPTALDLGDYKIMAPEDFETERDAFEYYGSTAYEDIMTLSEANNEENYDRVNYYSQYTGTLFQSIVGVIDIDNNANPDEIMDLFYAEFNVLDDEIKADFLDECYNCLLYVLTGEGEHTPVFPTITVFDIVDTNNSGISFDWYDGKICEIIDPTINYIVKTAECENGEISTVSTAKMGETVDITVTANDGYKVSKVSVNAEEIKAVDGKYSYVMTGNTGIEISAEFEKLPVEDKPATPPAADNTGNTNNTNNTDNGTKSPATGDNTVLPIIAILSLGAIVIAKKKIEA